MSASNANRKVATTVGANLRAARDAAGLTQHELAVKVGQIDAMAISRWERGVNRPRDDRLLRLADILGCELAWFYTEHERIAA